LHVDRHSVEGSKVRLYVGDGSTEMDLTSVRGFEPDGFVPQISEAAAPPAAGIPASAVPRAASPAEMADAAADRYGLPRKLVRTVMSAESGFEPDAISPRGAIGLMQLMPGTAQTLGANPRDPAQNVDAGARYLRDLLVKYNGQLWHALAAYNAGEGAVARCHSVPPYPETIRYITRIDRELKRPE
jgi:soluble lytic murein transglycosylase-like protein